jgi:hypothetical protein
MGVRVSNTGEELTRARRSRRQLQNGRSVHKRQCGHQRNVLVRPEQLAGQRAAKTRTRVRPRLTGEGMSASGRRPSCDNLKDDPSGPGLGSGYQDMMWEQVRRALT